MPTPCPVVRCRADGQPLPPQAGMGVVLEHRFGVVLLAHLLTGDRVPTLGDDVVPGSGLCALASVTKSMQGECSG
jgi:hypothetical protein